MEDREGQGEVTRPIGILLTVVGDDNMILDPGRGIVKETNVFYIF